MVAGLTLGTALSVAVPPAGASALAAARTAVGPAPDTLTWSPSHPASAPPALQHATAAYDADTSSVVMFGGLTAAGTLSNDTWVWDGRTWTEHPAASMTQAPPPRRDASMAFDPSLHQLILFGGQGSNGTFLGDTWAWNGASWYQLPPGRSGSPGARSGAALALGPNGNLVLFGGMGASPVNGVDSTTSTPSSSTAGAAAPAAASSSGTQVLGDTWQWTSKGWAPASAPGPVPRWGASMAYDSTNRTTVLFSGNAAVAGAAAQPVPGTWVWDGSQWARQSASASPPVRFDGVMADDPAAGGVVLTTGATGSGLLDDGWIWDGSGWSPAQTSGSSPREGAAAAFDAARSELVIFGGSGPGGSTLGDTEDVVTTKPAATSPTTVPAPDTPTTSAQASSVPTTQPQQSIPPPVGATTSTTSRPASTTTTGPQGKQPTQPSGTVSLAPSSTSPMTLQTNEHNVHQGASVELAGSGFAPGSPVTISFHSSPSLVGRSTAGPQGDFTATVAVPRTARPGQHQFVATGRSADGKPITLVAAVQVLGPVPHGGTSLPIKLGMLALALLIPTGAWLGMTGAGWWRRRARG